MSLLVLPIIPAILRRVNRTGRHAQFLPLVAALALGACAAPVTHFGDAPLSAVGETRQSFAMAPDDQGAAATAVRDALVAAGLQETADAPLRVEVGFAVRPRKLAVTAPGKADAPSVISPRGKAPPALCHRLSYVLTVALVDRASGAVQKRMGATISRCHGTPAAVLPELAQAAVAPSA